MVSAPFFFFFPVHGKVLLVKTCICWSNGTSAPLSLHAWTFSITFPGWSHHLQFFKNNEDLCQKLNTSDSIWQFSVSFLDIPISHSGWKFSSVDRDCSCCGPVTDHYQYVLAGIPISDFITIRLTNMRSLNSPAPSMKESLVSYRSGTVFVSPIWEWFNILTTRWSWHCHGLVRLL